jgi:hypothetical protein
MDGGAFLFWYLIFAVVGAVIWYFLNRASVRANRQIELLESIDKKLNKIIDSEYDLSEVKDKSAQGYLEEARKKAGL